MTLYAEPAAQTHYAPIITKIFSVMVWVELDRVRTGQRFYTVSITGTQEGMPDTFSYEVDGKVASMQDVGNLLDWAKSGGSVEQVMEEVAA